MRKIAIAGIVLCIIFICCILYLFNQAHSELNSTDAKYKKAIGEKFVLDKDTLLIIDYSILSSNFTLANGKTVSSELVFKQLNKNE